MVLWTIFARTIIIYFIVFIMLRIMGKREIGKLSIFDLVISIMIAEIAVFVLEEPNKPMLEGLLPMFTLVAIQLIIAYLIMKNLTLRRLFDGKPSYIIENGKLNRSEMRKQRYNLSDLMLQLRQSNITNIADVEFAILETTGKLTVVKKSELYGYGSGGSNESGYKNNPDYRFPSSGQPAAAGMEASSELGDLSVQTNISFAGLPLPLIMDGIVLDENLEKIGKSRYWLQTQIGKKGADDFDQVFFCTIDHCGRMFIDLK